MATYWVPDLPNNKGSRTIFRAGKTPKIMFLWLSLLPNPTETLATQATFLFFHGILYDAAKTSRGKILIVVPLKRKLVSIIGSPSSLPDYPRRALARKRAVLQRFDFKRVCMERNDFGFKVSYSYILWIKSTYPFVVLYSLLFASSSGRSNVIAASYRCVGFHS